MSNGLIFWISASWVIRAYIPNFSLLGDRETSGQPRNWFGRNYLLKVLVFWISGSSFWEIWHPWMLAFWKWCNIYNWTCSPWSWWTPPCPCSHCPPALGLLFEKFDIPGCWHFENGATHIIEHVHHGPDGLLHVLVLTVHLLWFLRMPSYVCYMKYIQCGNTFQALCSLIVA